MKKKKPFVFSSALKDQLNDYIKFKVAMGFPSAEVDYAAKQLDSYLLFRSVQSPKEIDEGFIVNWIHAIPTNAAGTKNTKLAFVRGFLGHLVRLGLLEHNPSQGIPYLRQTPYRPYIYTLQEIQQMLKAAPKHRCHYRRCVIPETMGTIIFLLYACGLRLGEVVKLNVEDVDFEEATISLWNTKFHKERIIPFSPAVGRRLRDYLECPKRARLPHGPKDPFFAIGFRRFNAESIRFQFFEILRRVGIAKPAGRGGPRLHDLRHTFAVHRLYKWYQEGHDVLNKLPLLSTYMGHVSIEGTQVYLTITQALMREGNRRFQDSFAHVAEKALARAVKKK